MREVMRDGHTEPRIRLAEVVARPNAHAVGALSGLSGEVTIVDGDVWVARVAGNGIQVTGPTLAEGDEAALLTLLPARQKRVIPALGARWGIGVNDREAVCGGE